MSDHNKKLIDSTEIVSDEQSDLTFDIIFDDKLDSTGVKLLSEQKRLIRTIKEDNENQR